MTLFTTEDVPDGPAVTSLRRSLPDTQVMGLAIGVARIVVGGVLLAVPTGAVKLLGVDSATAGRAAFVVRMLAVRDAALGVGTVDALPDRAAPWLLAGAASDAVDAVVLAGAIRSGVARGPLAALVAVGALVGAVSGIVAATEPR